MCICSCTGVHVYTCVCIVSLSLSSLSQSDRANWVVLSPEHAILLGKLSFSVRASPSATGQNYSCEVCLDLGFWQHIYISLALVVKGMYKLPLHIHVHVYTCSVQAHPLDWLALKNMNMYVYVWSTMQSI